MYKQDTTSMDHYQITRIVLACWLAWQDGGLTDVVEPFEKKFPDDQCSLQVCRVVRIKQDSTNLGMQRYTVPWDVYMDGGWQLFVIFCLFDSPKCGLLQMPTFNNH